MKGQRLVRSFDIICQCPACAPKGGVKKGELDAVIYDEDGNTIFPPDPYLRPAVIMAFCADAGLLSRRAAFDASFLTAVETAPNKGGQGVPYKRTH